MQITNGSRQNSIQNQISNRMFRYSRVVVFVVDVIASSFFYIVPTQFTLHDLFSNPLFFFSFRFLLKNSRHLIYNVDDFQ